MFTIKQRYTDPTNGSIKYIQIILNLDERRMEHTSSTMAQPILLAHSNNRGEESVYLNVEDYLINLLDAKRTSPPHKCYQTHLTGIYSGGLILNVSDSNHLNIFKNCPIAILSDLRGTSVDYAMVVDFNKSTLTLSNELKSKYYKGAFIHNLSNRWWQYPLDDELIGLKSKYCRPSSVNFSARFSEDHIDFLLHDVINRGIISVYDVYIRNMPFTVIEPHWIADIEDTPINDTNLIIKTYNGGYEAGGGIIEPGKEYHIGVVSKDKPGRFDVNESSPSLGKLLAVSN